MGRQLSYGFMVKKLSQIWARKGSIDVFDMENDFFLVSFQHCDDCMEALIGGPWVIADAYLSVSRWRPEFNPKNKRIDSIVAWVRLPDLPAPLFDKKFLLNLGNSTGKAIKLDIHTAQRARGKFARMCVELDLTKPLVPEFMVDGQILSVVYESLGLLCRKCGRVGHLMEGCERFHMQRNDGEMEIEGRTERKSEGAEKEGEGGPWKTVQRVRRQRKTVPTTPEIQGGSRFAALCEDLGAEPSGGGVKALDKASSQGMERRSQEGRTEKGTRVNHILRVSKQGNLGIIKSASLSTAEILKCGPTSSLGKYKGRGIQLKDKENLNPGDPMEGERDISAMDMGDMRVVDGIPGAASRGVASVVKDMKSRYKLDIIVILEPRIGGAQATRAIQKWGFKKSIRMEADGFSGGIWIIWERDDLHVDVLVKNEQFIHCQLRLGAESMLFTTVYANPHEQRRVQMRDDLQSLATNISGPWLLAGDFNEIKSPLEQKGGGRVNETRCRRFTEWIQGCGLIDVDTKGPFFTWKGPKWERLERVYKQLDRCLCNVEWLEKFENSVTTIVSRLCSDHHPILVNLNAEWQGYRAKSFKYEAMWHSHEKFEAIMRDSWRGDEEAHVKLTNLSHSLSRWNKEVFGKIEERKRRLLNRLNGIQQAEVVKECKVMRTDSEIWKSVAKIGPAVNENICWDICNGERALFWCDRWLDGGRSLCDLGHGHVSDLERQLRVADMADANGQWDRGRFIARMIVVYTKELEAFNLAKSRN
ncbi:hypothetical protein K1719_004751 [Acacia pycnantha]|nr:hypothetical protein K1719_004751 [Acacia pycnantha]